MQPATCLTEEQISALALGQLTGAALASAEAHLVSCQTCRERCEPPNAEADTARPDDASRRPLLPLHRRGDRVARYEIQELVGSGAMGRVYSAHDPALDRTIALKLLRPEVAIAGLDSRLLREAKALARISHPHVVAVHDAGRHGEEVYIAMEFVAGGTLRKWQQTEGRTWREVLAVYIQAGRGLAEAHAAGIIHRDFKPDNVLVSDDGKSVRVTDFGLARSATVGPPVPLHEADTLLANAPSEPLDAALTRTGAIVGTPVYMAPEQHGGEMADVQSDIFSFSVALYEGLYGARPFSATTLSALYQAKLLDRVNPAPEGARIPARVRRVVLEGLRSERKDRLASMAEMLARLEKAARTSRAPFIGLAAVLAAAAAEVLYGAGARHVTPTTSSSSAAIAAPLPPCSNRACAEAHDGEAWVCRPSDHTCVPVASAECRPYFEPGDLDADDTVWLGALFPTTGPIASIGQPNVDAVNLARREFAEATRSLPEGGASFKVRRIAVAVCDDATSDGAMRAAKHLADDVGVPAILGFRSGQEVMDLTGSLLIQRKIVSIATLTTSPLITQIPQPADLPRMVWRTTFSLNDAARATAAFVRDYFEPRRGSRSRPSRLALVRGASPALVAFGQALLKSLVLNGRRGVDNGDLYLEVEVPQNNGEEQIDRAVDRVAASAPDFVIVNATHYAPLVAGIEARWNPREPRPIYLLEGEAPGSMQDFLEFSRPRRHRVFGLTSRSTSTANEHFVTRFNLAYDGGTSRAMNPGSSYDAFYMVAFAASTGQGHELTGVTLARGFERFVPSGLSVEVGPARTVDALSQLKHGHSIHIEGANTALDFDSASGEATFDYTLVCAASDASGRTTGETIESGLTLVASSPRVQGVLRCP